MSPLSPWGDDALLPGLNLDATRYHLSAGVSTPVYTKALAWKTEAKRQDFCSSSVVSAQVFCVTFGQLKLGFQFNSNFQLKLWQLEASTWQQCGACALRRATQNASSW